MKIRLSRTVHLQRLRRIAAVGKEEHNRAIYLAFLQHIAETPSATYRTINTEMLNVIPENQRGKAIVEMLAKDGLVQQDDTLSLTQMGKSVLAMNKMMEPHADDYLFTVIDDPLLPHQIYAYQPNKEKSGKKYVAYQYLQNDVSWLKRPAYPTYENETSVFSRCLPMEYRLLGKPDAVLYLYSICESGPALLPSEDTCMIELSAGEQSTVTVSGTHTVTVPAAVSLSQILAALDLSGASLSVQGDTLVSIRDFRDLSPEERTTGLASLELSRVDAGVYGVFTTVVVEDIPIVVSDPAMLYSWAKEHLMLSIRSYMDERAYAERCRETAEWAVSRCTVPVTAEDVLAVLPPFNELLEEIRYPSESFLHVMEMNPGLCWYFLAPQYLRFGSGGDAS
ncbi:MAG TPA: hypothetical protein O0X50_02000 [Methanocorpusculum sp.]|nr:hypothetical protein [Methanocorpusculum sp.]